MAANDIMNKLTRFNEIQATYVRPKPKINISTSEDCYKIILPLFEDEIDLFERSILLLLNRANNVIGHKILSTGGISGTVIDLKCVALFAVKFAASSVILAHNHPSGELKPSNSDKEMTCKIRNGLNMLDIVLLDHLIVTSEGYFSFADEGLI